MSTLNLIFGRDVMSYEMTQEQKEILQNICYED
jgi:chemotaxis methyl-accepting protein methylase